MAGVSYHFDLDDLVVLSTLDQVAAAGEDLLPLMDAIGRVLVAGAVERIGTTNVDPAGVAWPQSLRAKEKGGPTLHDTGRLMRSITMAPESRQVTVGSNLIYAGVHQTGATIRPKSAGALHFTLANGEQVMVGEVTIPRRSYLGVSSAEAEDISAITVAHFTDLLGGGLH